MRSFRRWFAVIATSLVLLAGSLGEVAAATAVTENDLGAGWSTNDTRPGGSVAFVDDALQMVTTSSSAKAQLFYYGYMGLPLSSIYGLSYDALRLSSSTASAAQTISLNIEVDYVGDGSTYTTLVFEPVYQAGGAGAIGVDAWQTWDAYASGGAIWWSTRAIPGVCAFTCYVTWSDIVASNPNAIVVGGLGVNIGSGWSGQFIGYADFLTVNGDVFDFVTLVGPPTSKDECKNGGWQSFNNPPFKNQGDCVSYVASSQ